MTSDPPTIDATRLLGSLTKAPADARPALLRKAGAPAEVLPLLADAVERLAVTEASRGLEVGQLVASLAEAVGGPLEQARAQRARGQALAYAGQFVEALGVFEEAIRLADDAGHDLEGARARMSSMHALNSLGRSDQSIAAGEHARTVFLRMNEIDLAARADSNLGATYRVRDNPRKALEHFDRARPLFEPESVARAQVDSNRGHALLNLDEFAASEQAYLAALPVFSAAGMSWAAAVVEGNLAELASRQGRLQRALAHFERARRHLEQDDAQPELARLAAERAEALLTLGAYEQALDDFDTAVPLLEKHEMALEAARARSGLAQALLRLRRLDQAEPALAVAAERYAALGSQTGRARLDVLRSEVAQARGKVDEALRLIEGAARDLTDRPVDATICRYHRARLRIESGDCDQALVDIEAALQQADALGLTPLSADLLHLRAQVHRQRSDTQRAAADLREAVRLIEQQRGTLQAQRFRASYLGNRIAAYEDLIVTLLDQEVPDIPAAFATVERAKSRSLLEAVADTGEAAPELSRDSAEATLRAGVGRLRGELNALYSRLADAQFGKPDQQDAARRQHEIRRRERDLVDLEARLAVCAPATSMYAAPLQLDAVRERIPKRTALIEYFIAGDELMAFQVRRDGAQVARCLATTDELSDATRRLRFQFRRALRPGAVEGTSGERMVRDARRELRKLRGLLLDPLEVSLGHADRLLIVPHGELHAIPFHALWDGHRYLSEQVEVVYAPSASLLRRSDTARPLETARSTGDNGIVIGVADALAPQVACEATTVAGALGEAHLLLGEHATRARVMEQMQGAEVIHFAAHGVFSPTAPLASGIKLADGWLTVHDVLGLRLRAKLVTLSGCETGRNVVETGDELTGLVRAFLAAGTAAMVVSLWAVHDQTTGELMRAFHERWRRGGSRASAALRGAQLEVLSRHPHPVSWAPFILIGDA